MQEESVLRITRHGKVLLLELNRPDRYNAFSDDLQEAFWNCLAEADRDPETRAIVVTGVGEAFCVGADLKKRRNSGWPDGADEKEEKRYFEAALHVWWRRDKATSERLMSIMEMEKPVIAAVNGWALGWGLWLCLACDITIAAKRAVFGQPEVRHSVTSTFLFPALVGWKNAHRYALTGDHFDADEALRIGAINQVVADDELLPTALALAQRLAMVPAASLRINKAITSRGMMVSGLKAAMELNAQLSIISHASNDSAETEHLNRIRAEQGAREMVKQRDLPFLPEPFGPRSKPRGKAK